MKMLLKILTSFALFGIVVLISLRIPNTQLTALRDRVVDLFIPPPCSEPIAYNIGTFDDSFNISREYFINALADAEIIWEKPSGMDLFVYMPFKSDNDVLTVNLVYDYRQEATSKLDGLGLVVKDNKASYDTLKAKFNNLTIQYEKDKITFEALVIDFNQKNKTYEAEVSYWNKRGGAPRDDFAALEAERAALEAESKEFKTLQTNINNKANEINALVSELNRLVGVLNLSVDKYNTVNNTRGESFEEGVYYNDGYKAGIDIYEFSSEDKLVRVLAHELGHALNLDHVDDKRAIMYYLNHDSNMVLTQADIDELKIKCEIK